MNLKFVNAALKYIIPMTKKVQTIYYAEPEKINFEALSDRNEGLNVKFNHEMECSCGNERPGYEVFNDEKFLKRLILCTECSK